MLWEVPVWKAWYLSALISGSQWLPWGAGDQGASSLFFNRSFSSGFRNFFSNDDNQQLLKTPWANSLWLAYVVQTTRLKMEKLGLRGEETRVLWFSALSYESGFHLYDSNRATVYSHCLILPLLLEQQWISWGLTLVKAAEQAPCFSNHVALRGMSVTSQGAPRPLLCTLWERSHLDGH